MKQRTNDPLASSLLPTLTSSPPALPPISKVINIESLAVDPHLTRYTDDLRAQLARSSSTSTATASDDLEINDVDDDSEELRNDAGESEDADEAKDRLSEAMEESQIEVVVDSEEDMQIEVEVQVQGQEPGDGWLLPPQAPEHKVSGSRLVEAASYDGAEGIRPQEYKDL